MLKRWILLVLCLSVPPALFGCMTASSAEQVPTVHLSTYSDFVSDASDAEQKTNYYSVGMQITDCADFASMELLITYNPSVLELCDYPDAFVRCGEFSKRVQITNLQAGKIRVIGTQTLPNQRDNICFDGFVFKVIGEGDTNVSAALVSYKNSNGEIDRCILDADILNYRTDVTE